MFLWFQLFIFIFLVLYPGKLFFCFFLRWNSSNFISSFFSNISAWKYKFPLIAALSPTHKSYILYVFIVIDFKVLKCYIICSWPISLMLSAAFSFVFFFFFFLSLMILAYFLLLNMSQEHHFHFSVFAITVPFPFDWNPLPPALCIAGFLFSPSCKDLPSPVNLNIQSPSCHPLSFLSWHLLLDVIMLVYWRVDLICFPN